MNLYHLRYFVTLAHMEHYTRAADLLAITQPSLSHAISSLESELGVKLFKKNGRNVTLTKYGKSFLTDAEEILENLDRKERWVKGTMQAPDGSVSGSAECAANELPVSSIREGEVPGIHVIRYESEADSIILTHDAKNRKGFALGAVLAAEFTDNKEGYLGMSDLFPFLK